MLRMDYRRLALFFWLIPTAAGAASVQEITVARDGQFIVSEANFTVDVPRREVVAAFSSFAELARLNPAILDSHAVAEGHNRSLVTTRLRDCVAMFCRTVTLAERVEVLADGTIRSEIVPEVGDFTAGHAAWTFEAEGQQTRVTYRSNVKPDFWLPPLLGKRAMRTTLRRQIEASIETLEAGTRPDLFDRR